MVQSLLSTETDIEVVGMSTTVQDAMIKIGEKVPDIILLDVYMSNVNGIKTTVHIKDNYPHIKVIFLAIFSKKELVLAGIMASADGFLLKNIDTENLLQSIRNAYHNQIAISGDAERILAQRVMELKYDYHDILPGAFVDDDLGKQRMQIYNIPVLGKVQDITTIVEKEKIDHIVIAIPSLKNGYLSKIVTECNKTNAKVQMIPKIEDIMTGRVSVSHLKNVEVEDLLGREPVELDINTISEYFTGKTVMVTGAGGSVGSEICRQLMRLSPEKIALVGHGEYSIYTIDMEIREKHRHEDLEMCLKAEAV